MNTGEPGKPGFGQDGRDGHRGRPGVPGLPGVPGPPGAHGLNGYCDPSACNLQAGAAQQSLDVKGPAGNWQSHRQRPRDWRGRDQLLRARRTLLRVFAACLPGCRSSINLQPFVPATSPSEGGRPRVIKKQKSKKKEAFHERCKNLIWCIFVPESCFQKILLPFLGDDMKWPEILFIPLSLYLCLQFSFLTFSPPSPPPFMMFLGNKITFPFSHYISHNWALQKYFSWCATETKSHLFPFLKTHLSGSQFLAPSVIRTRTWVDKKPTKSHWPQYIL